MKIETAYAVWTTTNEWGSRGSRVGVFSSRTAADDAAKGQGWYGGIGTVEPVHVFRYEGKVYQLESANPIDLDLNEAKQRQKMREAARAKLTPIERELLGLE